MDKKILIRQLASAAKAAALRFHDYEKETREYLPGHPVYMREADLLDALGEDGLTMSEIASALKITQGAATQIVRRLVRKGYISRTQAEDDKRRIYVVKTPLGQRIDQAHQAYEEHVYGKMYELLSDLTPEDIRRFISFEKKIVDILDEVQYRPLA